MAVGVAITNLDYTAADLRRLMSKERGGEVVRRLSALALVLEGHSRTVAAAQSGMDRQTLRDWVHRYNEGGIAALASGKSTGRRPKLDAAEMGQLYDLVVKVPTLRSMAWCAGDVLTCGPKLRTVFQWMCRSARLPNGCAGCA